MQTGGYLEEQWAGQRGLQGQRTGGNLPVAGAQRREQGAGRGRDAEEVPQEGSGKHSGRIPCFSAEVSGG